MEDIKIQNRKNFCQMKAKNFVILYLTFVIVVSQVITTVLSYHIPNNSRYGLMRRQDDIDSDGDDELDSGASAPYQNQDEGQGADGYEDNEPDGSYGETPREEEGQADLERFFDDHLGASEKDGMDKENLPSNVIPIIIPLIKNTSDSSIKQPVSSDYSNARTSESISAPSYHAPGSPPMATSESTKSNYIEQEQSNSPHQLPNVETRFIQLPNNKLIITRQSITRGPVYKGGIDLLPQIPPIPEHYLEQAKLVEDLEAQQNNIPTSQQYEHQDEDNLNAHGSDHVIATENEDSDRVYVTRLTNKPFRIRALGGYDPEEDFRDASRDILEDRPSRVNRQSTRRNKSRKNNRREGKEDAEEESKQKDISFNDPEPDTLFNDASETDEVTFDGSEEPYQTDLEAEMHAQAYDKPGMPTNFAKSKQYSESLESPKDPPQLNIPRESRRVASSRRKEKHDDDYGEGSWVNDGVDEMDIPSQSHQEGVLAKAAEQEALARRQAEEEAAADAQQAAADQPPEDPENQRMNNADYLKDDLLSLERDQEDDN